MNSAFVAIVGRPNVGKSTLVNALVGSKVSITSERPQTTRNTIRGVVHRPGLQLVLVDLPGIHKPKTALGDRLNKMVYRSLDEADTALFVLDATSAIGPGDRLIASRLQDDGLDTVVAVNKVDVAGREQVATMLAEAGDWDFAAYVPVSALTGTGLEELLAELAERAPSGPAFFPADMVTDQSEATIVSELIREKWLGRLHQELPHSLAVVVDEIVTRDNGTTYVGAHALVERQSQKGIVIGRQGELLKRVGSEARAELESFLGTPVYLDLRVRVEKEWQDTPSLLDRLGF